MLNNSGADTLVVDEVYVERIRFVENDLSSLKCMIVCDGKSPGPGEEITVEAAGGFPSPNY